jgi:hypothetical protein
VNGVDVGQVHREAVDELFASQAGEVLLAREAAEDFGAVGGQVLG